jgi:Variant SH3 domain
VKLEVTQPYTRSSDNPIAFLRGERVRVVKRDEDNLEWIWCVADDAREGWVHESFLELHGDEATGRQSYTALELTISAHAQLEGIECVSGWWFCRNAAGEVGWVPAESVSKL